MTEIIKYRPIYVIETYDQECYFLPEDQYKVLLEKLNNDRFIELDGELLACASVKRVYKDRGDDLVIRMSRDQRKRFMARCYDFEKNLGYPPSDAARQNIARKILGSGA